MNERMDSMTEHGTCWRILCVCRLDFLQEVLSVDLRPSFNPSSITIACFLFEVFALSSTEC